MVNWKLWFRKNFLTHVERRVLKQIRGTTLDLGCGRGLFLFYCAHKNSDVIGIDVDKNKIKEAKTIPINSVLLGDAYQLPFGDNTFNILVALDILEHLKNPKQVIKEMDRVLKTGEKVLFMSHAEERFSDIWKVI